MGVVHRRYGLTAEDCEEIVDDILLAWHRKLATKEGVRSDRGFCRRVLRDRAVERLRRKALPTVDLSEVEQLGYDPHLDALVAEREELLHMREVAREVLEPREYLIVRLVEQRLGRAAVGDRFGLSPRQVKRTLERARAKLDVARSQLEEHGRCAMVAATIAEINAGAVDPGDRRRIGALEHLAGCPRCRGSLSIDDRRPE